MIPETPNLLLHVVDAPFPASFSKSLDLEAASSVPLLELSLRLCLPLVHLLPSLWNRPIVPLALSNSVEAV